MLKNKMVEGYWHIPQIIFLIAVYLLPYFLSFDWKYLITIGALGMQFPFLFNTGLNAYMHKEIGERWVIYVGKYDFLKFWQTVVLFALGVLVLLYQFRII
jgi:hypothetical protein